MIAEKIKGVNPFGWPQTNLILVKACKMGIWSNLLGSAVRSVTFNAWDNLGVLPATFYKRFVRGKGGRMHYKSLSAYKSVVAYRVFRTAVSAAYDEVNALVPRYQKFLRETMRKPVQEQQEGNRKLLVLNSRFTDKGLGTVLMDDGVHQFVAKDAWGRIATLRFQTPIHGLSFCLTSVWGI